MTSSPRHYQYYLVMGPDFYGSVGQWPKLVRMMKNLVGLSLFKEPVSDPYSNQNETSDTDPNKRHE